MRLAGLQKNHKKYIEMMLRFSDKKLSKNLDTIRLQISMAYQKQNHQTLAALQEAEDQIIEARLQKFDKPIKKKK